MGNTIANNGFEKWLYSSGYKDTTIKGYIYALNNVGRYLTVSLEQPILSIMDINEFDQLDSYLRSLPNFGDVDYKTGHGNLSSGLGRYREYLMSGQSGKGGSCLPSITAFQALLAAYKKDFPSIWKNEQFKWRAVQTFKTNWNLDAENLADMIAASLDSTYTKGLLDDAYNTPRKALIQLADDDPVLVREMFADLYDDHKDLIERIKRFKVTIGELYAKYNHGQWKKNYYDDNIISTLLWLNNPEQYYIYKYSYIRALAHAIGSDFHMGQDPTINVQNCIGFYNGVRAIIQQDDELRQMLNQAIASEPAGTCYPDEEMSIMTLDVAHYVAAMKDVPSSSIPDTYSAEEFLSDVFMTPEDYGRLTGLLKRKKNAILQGPPGVGKTYAAKRLAYSMMNAKDPARVRVVQFHQSYSYEDFIEGYRPLKDGGFELRHGAFYTFCDMARNDTDHPYFFIIDEINRGNLSKIFGELFMLIESDKRNEALELLYSGELFSIPENLYIIGLMNTADRSLAMLDYALRRRFAFFKMEPQFDSPRFREYQEGLHSATFDAIIRQVKKLNDQIAEDPSLREGFKIGHSYFCHLSADSVDEDLPAIVEYELIPLLDEYWFDNEQKRTSAANEFYSALKTKNAEVQ